MKRLTSLYWYPRKTRTRYDVCGVKVFACLQVRADALDVTPTMGAFAADRTVWLNIRLNCDLVMKNSLAASEGSRAGRRPAGRALRKWGPFQLGVVNANPYPA